ncbi:TRAP transporter substrate-binding protein DctP [Martelella sp. FOR1707]
MGNNSFKGRLLQGAALAIGILAVAGSAQADGKRLKWSHFEPIGSIVDTTTNAMAEEIEAKTDGRIQFDVFPASQLGDWNEVSQQVERGIVDFATQPVAATSDPRLNVRVLPYSVMNYAEAEKAYFGDDAYMFDLMAELMSESNLTALGVVAQGFGGGGFSEECPDEPFELGISRTEKMRFPPGNQAWEKLVQALGYSPAAVPWSELYLGLQTGVVDAQVGGQPASTLSNFRDVTKCWVQYNTHFQNSFVFANSETFDAFSEEDQKTVRDIVTKYAMESMEMAREADRKSMDEMVASGITVITPSDEQLATLAKGVREQVWLVMDPTIGKDIMDMMRGKAGL